jgi:hypothetical protein
MPAYTQKTRQAAIALYEQEKTIASISAELKVSYRTVQTWIKNYKALGLKGLVANYGNCGRSSQYASGVIERAVGHKADHPDWGAPFILLKLEDDFPGERLPGARWLQKIFVKRRVQRPKDRLPKGDGKWADKPFARVQVDAKERLRTKDGQACCYLNFTDEHTGSDLDAFVFPLCPDM